METVYTESLAGSRDSILLDVCRLEKRILITLDLDFANMMNFPPGTHVGIVVLRLSKRGRQPQPLLCGDGF